MPLRTLGDLALEGTALHRPKPLLLLAYLAFEGMTPRRRLAELFFGDAKDPADSLSTALKYLKQHPAAALDLRSKTVATEVECDARLLLNDLEKNYLTAAIGRYQGPFLSTFELSLGEELEEWVYGTREFLARSVRGALLRLAEEEAAQGQSARAASRAERAYTLAGAPELEPEEIEQLYAVLVEGGSPRAAELKREAADIGITLAPVVKGQTKVSEAAPASATSHNLPKRGTAFVGRDLELVEIATLLNQDACRLLTLIGPGGIGKTRLALQAGWEAPHNNPSLEGVYFVPLESVTSHDRIPEVLARALDLDLKRQAATVSAIIESIGDRATLLILDNFEHLLEGAVVASELLQACPNLNLLVTSRERLNLQEEWLLPIEGLDYPEDNLPLEKIAAYDAVRLFIQRGMRVLPGFVLTEEMSPHIIRLCRLVRGLPLGLELAAPWVRMMSVSEIAAQIERNLDLLDAASRNAPERQRSMRATFEYSWQLLTLGEQEVLRKLTVFHGGFTKEAAAAVTGASLQMLASLVNKSLLQVKANSRYDTHPLIQYYAQERLEEWPEEKLQTQEKQTRYFLALAEEAMANLHGPQQVFWLEHLETELDNLRAVLDFAVKHCQVSAGLRLAWALGEFWETRGYLNEGCAYLAKALAQPGAEEKTSARANALVSSGVFALIQSDNSSARLYYEEALNIDRALGGKRTTASCLTGLGHVAIGQNDYILARSLLKESLVIRRELGDERGAASTLHNLGVVAWNQGDYLLACSLIEECLTAQRALAHPRGVALSLSALGSIAVEQKNYSFARSLLEESLTIWQGLRNETEIAEVLHSLGNMAADHENYTLAFSLYNESLVTLRRSNDNRGLARLLTSFGLVSMKQGNSTLARSRFEESLKLGQKIGEKRHMAYALEAFATLASFQGYSGRTVVLWGAAEALRRAIGAPLAPRDHSRFESDEAAARNKLNEERFMALWSKGQAMSLEEAAIYALTTCPDPFP